MKSEIRVATSNLRVIVPVTIVSAITIIILAFAFRAEFGAILLSIAFTIGSIAGIAIIGKVSQLYHAGQLAKIERAKMQQELRLATYEADKAEFQRFIAHFSKNERIVLHQDAPYRLIEAMADTPKVINGQAQLLPAKPINLLSALDSVARGLIVGVTNTGKTTLMRWLVWRRLQTSKVIVLDPHASPDKWPAGALVVGKGRDYAGIDAKLQALLALMDSRYTEIGNGTVPEGHHSPLTILIDEWRAIVRALGDSASDAIRALLTESRKAAFSVFIASQSDRAKPLGLDGEYDLKDSFAIVRLALVDGQRQATIDTGSGEVLAELPGAFAPGVSLPGDMGSDEPTAEEQNVLTLHSEGKSYRQITWEVWQQYGSFYNNKVDEILAKWGEK